MKEIKRKNIKWWVGVMSFAILFLGIGFFAYTRMSFMINGVQIKASLEKREGSSIVEVTGNAKNATVLTLNGREIYIEKDGTFTESIALLPGLAIIEIDARDKFGKSAAKKFEVVYQKDADTFAFNKEVN